MGFLKSRKIKNKTYWYWCERKRDSKKAGGSGKVKSIELLLGDSYLAGKWISWLSFTGDIPVNEFIENVVKRYPEAEEYIRRELDFRCNFFHYQIEKAREIKETISALNKEYEEIKPEMNDPYKEITREYGDSLLEKMNKHDKHIKIIEKELLSLSPNKQYFYAKRLINKAIMA